MCLKADMKVFTISGPYTGVVLRYPPDSAGIVGAPDGDGSTGVPCDFPGAISPTGGLGDF